MALLFLINWMASKKSAVITIQWPSRHEVSPALKLRLSRALKTGDALTEISDFASRRGKWKLFCSQSTRRKNSTTYLNHIRSNVIKYVYEWSESAAQVEYVPLVSVAEMCRPHLQIDCLETLRAFFLSARFSTSSLLAFRPTTELFTFCLISQTQRINHFPFSPVTHSRVSLLYIISDPSAAAWKLVRAAPVCTRAHHYLIFHSRTRGVELLPAPPACASDPFYNHTPKSLDWDLIFALSASLLRYQVSLRANCMRTPGVCILASRVERLSVCSLRARLRHFGQIISSLPLRDFWQIFILFLDGSVQI